MRVACLNESYTFLAFAVCLTPLLETGGPPYSPSTFWSVPPYFNLGPIECPWQAHILCLAALGSEPKRQDTPLFSVQMRSLSNKHIVKNISSFILRRTIRQHKPSWCIFQSGASGHRRRPSSANRRQPARAPGGSLRARCPGVSRLGSSGPLGGRCPRSTGTPYGTFDASLRCEETQRGALTHRFAERGRRHVRLHPLLFNPR